MPIKYIIELVITDEYDLHFCMVFHVRWIFLTTSLLRRWWDSETSGEKSISHGKPYRIHFLAYFTLQGTLIVLNTLRKVEDRENHVRWIYLTTVLCMWESQNYARRVEYMLMMYTLEGKSC